MRQYICGNELGYIGLDNGSSLLTHWGRVTHICVGKQTIIGSDNGLSPEWRQAIIWTNAGILLIGPLGTNFSEISIKIQTFSFTKLRLKVSSAKWRPFCIDLNVLSAPALIIWNNAVTLVSCKALETNPTAIGINNNATNFTLEN